MTLVVNWFCLLLCLENFAGLSVGFYQSSIRARLKIGYSWNKDGITSKEGWEGFIGRDSVELLILFVEDVKSH